MTQLSQIIITSLLLAVMILAVGVYYHQQFIREEPIVELQVTPNPEDRELTREERLGAIPPLTTQEQHDMLTWLENIEQKIKTN